MDPVSVFNGRHRIRHHVDLFMVLQEFRQLCPRRSVLKDIKIHSDLLKALLRKVDTATLIVLADEETEIVF